MEPYKFVLAIGFTMFLLYVSMGFMMAAEKGHCLFNCNTYTVEEN